MKLFAVIIVYVALALHVRAISDRLTDLMTWDEYSLLVNGSRVYIFSGEIHCERVPVPALWRDVLEKYKANGLNAVSIYYFWSYHSARQGQFDFTGPGKSVQELLDIAKDVGLYVIARPGPYDSAETNGEGLALWGSDGSLGGVRTSDEKYHQAWLPYITEISTVLAANQITHGGDVILQQIENELQETTHDPNNTLVVYMEQIENATRSAGERSGSWSTDYENVGGAVNVYGLDSHPGGLSCTNINSGFQVVRNYYQWFQNYSYTQPEFLPEFEAGNLLGWGTYFYDQCLAEHDPAFDADGKYIPQIGPQTRFPFPPGVINNNGANTISIALWAQTDAGARLSNCMLFTYGQYQTGFDFNQDWSALQPMWTADRLHYVWCGVAACPMHLSAAWCKRLQMRINMRFSSSAYSVPTRASKRRSLAPRMISPCSTPSSLRDLLTPDWLSQCARPSVRTSASNKPYHAPIPPDCQAI
ncbi:glycoside hydrolase family 35 protein [Baudoinia panamericana UAMH 10762]|uniref:beta-galactosidase n=1 Tax=Baudoinia panamericana (strain UAMH 10762) TaxID=717646 RepID=M2MRE2_BAUPA|nr:glycoside hydrolase family 35 protein [Baudoinia panamericana UAMH 10762]EMC99411.1 glycoside hydrolase family 35 protein [Baudoinia panamericana UAMH 10762]